MDIQTTQSSEVDGLAHREIEGILTDRYKTWLPQNLHYLLHAIRRGTFVLNERVSAVDAREIDRELSLMEVELNHYFLLTGQAKLPGSLHLMGLPDFFEDGELDPMKALLEMP